MSGLDGASLTPPLSPFWDSRAPGVSARPLGELGGHTWWEGWVLQACLPSRGKYARKGLEGVGSEGGEQTEFCDCKA